VNIRQKRQRLCFTIEGLNSFATVLYFNYLYFFLQAKFGFSDKANLAVAALLGLCYAVSSWQAGRLAQRWGYFTALKLGFGIMAGALLIGAQLGSATGEIIAAVVATLGMCFTWPVLEALISENETPDRVPSAVGIYNIIWAATNAVAFFIGGMLIEKLGYHSIFYIPMGIFIAQFALTRWLEKMPPPAVMENHSAWPRDANHPGPARAKMFQQLAWLANPFAYIAINTLIAVLPGVAAKFQLTPMFAGFACSLWGFVRLAAFVALWRWPGWHYRFRWLVTAFSALVLSFAAILIVPSLVAVLVAQLFFGAAIGLIYYSSLFYSMAASDTKSEHGGIHEAAIGAGNCLGPAVGAASLQFLPQFASSGVIAVSVLLLCGLGGMAAVWKRGIKNEIAKTG
jgi:predicted MFS family arabinose efflux permease